MLEKWNFTLLKKNLYRNVYSNLILRAPNGNKPGGLTSEVLAYHGIPPGNTKEETTDKGNNLNKSWGNFAEWKKPIPKDSIVYDPLW